LNDYTQPIPPSYKIGCHDLTYVVTIENPNELQTMKFGLIPHWSKKKMDILCARVEGDKNKKAGEDFLAANGKKSGVITLPSGLQYEIIKTGTGPKPKAEDEVKCHYHGTTIDGKVFDSSVNRGEPASFGVNRVIPGWTEALQLMPVGSKWKLFIPSALAYGEQAPSPEIKSNSVLVFEVELLEIVKK